jgi:type VI secretion system protein ImpK
LADEIGKKLVVLAPGPILRLTAAFDSGKDQVRTEYMPLLHKVGQALKDGTSRIEVTGHTDDKPIRSVRFPSNWHLSVARAKAVEEILDSYGPFGDRISFEGKADRHPIADNKTNEGRAINRRIDIYIR